MSLQHWGLTLEQVPTGVLCCVHQSDGYMLTFTTGVRDVELECNEDSGLWFVLGLEMSQW